jgi:hypothetical protein
VLGGDSGETWSGVAAVHLYRTIVKWFPLIYSFSVARGVRNVLGWQLFLIEVKDARNKKMSSVC